jgi:hypothetical protein
VTTSKRPSGKGRRVASPTRRRHPAGSLCAAATLSIEAERSIPTTSAGRTGRRRKLPEQTPGAGRDVKQPLALGGRGQLDRSGEGSPLERQLPVVDTAEQPNAIKLAALRPLRRN